MLIRFTKGRGKPDTLACRRDDGSCTWSPLNFTTHDFGHYAIETTQGWRDAFFGLLAQGWDIADFGLPDARTGRKPPVPTQAMQAEALAGLMDVERRSASPPDYPMFMEMLSSACVGMSIPVPALGPALLAAIRRRHSDLLYQWGQVPEGEALELSF